MFHRQIGRRAHRLSQPFRQRARPAARANSTSTAEVSTPTSGSRSNRGGSLGMTLYALAFTTIGAGSTFYYQQRYGLGMLSDAQSLRQFQPGDDHARQTEEYLNAHPLTAYLRTRKDLVESRPHMKLPLEMRKYSLTGGTLQGPGKMVVPPLIFADPDGKEITGIVYAGENLCGHKGIVHGGFAAIVLDEGLARCCMGVMPHKIAVTANLNINYRKPIPSDSFVVLRAETIKLDGRKGWVKGRLESLVSPGDKPVVYAEAEALYISPKYAAMMPKVV